MAQAKKALVKKSRKGGRAAAKSGARTFRNYVGGEWVAGSETFEDLDPYTGEVMARVPAGEEPLLGRRQHGLHLETRAVLDLPQGPAAALAAERPEEADAAVLDFVRRHPDA